VPPNAPPPPDELTRVLREQDWETVRAVLFAVARRKTGSHAAAEELADSVIADCCDPDAAPWNPNGSLDLQTHALYVLRDKLSAERKKERVRSDPRNAAAAHEKGPHPVEPEQAHAIAAEDARRERILERARARLRDPLDVAVFDLSVDGMDKPADQAIERSWPVGVHLEPGQGPARRRPVVWVLALATAAAALLFVGTNALNPGGGALDDSPGYWAGQFRDYAAADCAYSSWARCQALLDRAREIDPDGEQEERVRAMRRAILEAGDIPPAPR
jgi:hypothetical protein